MGIVHRRVGEEDVHGHLIETDGRSRVVLPGHPNEKFLVIEQSDGSLLLQPAVVVTAAPGGIRQ